MPDKNVFIILNRAFVDERFRAQLTADLDGTVAGMGLTLTGEARAELKRALDEGHDFATGLDQRVSQSGFALNPASLIRQKGVGKEHVTEINVRNTGALKARHQNSEKKHASSYDSTVPEPNATASEPIEYDELDIEVETD